MGFDVQMFIVAELSDAVSVLDEVQSCGRLRG
jgi:hypothetical protein